MSDTPTDQPEHSKRGDGFPGRDDWNQVHDRFRRQVSRLARDPDPETAAEAGRIVHRATQMLASLTTRAAEAQEKADQERAQLERDKARLARQLRRAGSSGRPLSPGLLQLLEGGARPERAGTPDDVA
ncbi:hypothetical protein [Streptomyces sp. NPDC058678]|uniref:hypothetical protein n=1 Tax=Streptomyces sp. NPDC058678 TaxID=3346595 RepID=UPI003657C7AA